MHHHSKMTHREGKMGLDDSQQAGAGAGPPLVLPFLGSCPNEGGPASPAVDTPIAGSPGGGSTAKPAPPPKPQRRPKALLGAAAASVEGGSPSNCLTSPATAASPPATTTGRNGPPLPLSPPKRALGLQLLGAELALEASEGEQGLLSPFTSLMGLAAALNTSDESDEEEGSSTPEEQGPSPPTPLPPLPSPPSSLLDGVAHALKFEEAAAASSSPPHQQRQELGPQLALSEDGFVASPPAGSPATGAAATAGEPPPPSPAGKRRQPHLRRVSLPSLSAAIALSSSSSSSSAAASSTATPRSSGGLSLEALKAKLSGRAVKSTTNSPTGAPPPTTPTTTAPAEKEKREASLFLQSAQQLGWDVAGLRKALLVRVLGVEPSPTAAGSNSGGGGGDNGGKHRSASLGMMPAAWLKRSTNKGRHHVSPTAATTPTGAAASSSSPPVTPPSSSNSGSASSSSSSEQESWMAVIWCMDVESGHEWRVRKGPRDLRALHSVVSSLEPTDKWTPPSAADFPLLSGSEGGGGGRKGGALSVEKQARLERYLRELAAATSGSFEAAKTLQDFVGATERADALADAEAKGGPQARLCRLVQLEGLALLREEGTGYAARVAAFVKSARACDVQRTELLKVYVTMLDSIARDMLREHGPRLRAPLLRHSGLGLGLGGLGDPDEEVDRLCLSALWRLLEAESFLPLRLRLYERVMLETDVAQEKLLAGKCTLFKARPQSFFGIPCVHLSLSSWEAAVAHLRRLSGDVTTLPSDKLDALVAAVREVHATFRREHPGPTEGGGGGGTLSADDLLPIFIYILCQCGIARLLSLKTMLAELGEPARMLSEAGYCLATLDAACDYIVRMDDDAGEI